MELLPIDEDTLGLVVAWLAAPENHKWLDFGMGRQVVPAPMLKLMAAHKHNCLRAFTPDSTSGPVGPSPIGVVALSGISQFRTATLWYLLGNRDHRGQGLTTLAVSKMLDYGFRHLDLTAIQAWTAAGNEASQRILLKNGFRPAGRFRQAHVVDGVAQDRLLFDLLASDRAG